jgi:hypothetical protein
MCTVTFIPVKGGFYLTSNRDERPARGRPEWPAEYNQSFGKLLYPKDPKGKGTWIAADERRNVICLLNGAFKAHIPKPQYRKSRGLVVLDIFSFKSFNDFINIYDLYDIEPFSLVVVWEGCLIDFKWDGSKKYLTTKSMNEPKIWSSVTLYSQEVVQKKEKLFGDWISKIREINSESILSFHLSDDPDDPANAIKMKRSDVQTLSITSVLALNNSLSMLHYDLIQNRFRNSELKIKTG